jgi:hypothetical protein
MKQARTDPVHEKLALARQELSSALIERDEEVDLVLAALVAREHVLLAGTIGQTESSTMLRLAEKRRERGGFDTGTYLLGRRGRMFWGVACGAPRFGVGLRQNPASAAAPGNAPG